MRQFRLAIHFEAHVKIEYIEGQKATENFEEGMKALFKVPKDAVVKAEKKAKKRSSRVQSARKPKVSDKD
jgi:hypothetical protein